jgi:DNA primase
MNSPVEKIKERLSINDVISSYLPTIPAGKNYKAKCPFHNEKTPSFFISVDRGTYYCFGCGAKGDIFSFVENFEGLDFLGALKILAEKAGVPLVYDKNAKKEDREKLYDIMEEACDFFQATFDKYPEARMYLKERGVSDESIKSFRIGYAPDQWRSVSEYLIKKGYKNEDLETVGLIKKGNSGFYDRFRGRIMFPINDSSGRVIAFSGRLFALSSEKEKDSKDGMQAEMGAKYLNSPDTPLFNKSNVLFGIDKAKSEIRRRGYSIVVEGQIDLVLSHQASFTNTVAVSGTALSDDVSDSGSKVNNLGLIKRLSQNVIFAFDGDSAGIRAASRSAMIALSLDMQVKIAVLKEGMDPADIISKDINDWKEIIRNAVNIVEFHVNIICKNYNDTRIRGTKIREIVFPFLSVVKSSIERNAYIKMIHDKTGIREESIIDDFEVYERNNKLDVNKDTSTTEDSDKKMSRKEKLERRFFGIMYFVEKKEDKEEIKSLYNIFKAKIGDEDFSKMLSVYEPFSDTLAFETEMWYGSKTNEMFTDLKEILINLEEELLNEKKSSLLPLDTKEKLEEFGKISKRIEEIKQSRLSQ